MTVDELIERLDELSKQGLGNRQVRAESLMAGEYEVGSAFEYHSVVLLSD